MSEEEVRRIRGASIGLIPQSPGSALDPVLRVGRQIDEMYVLIEGKGQKEAKVLTIKRLNDVGFDDPEETYDTYPHRMSGGMCERALIAMGTALDPDLLVADEPTKGLDPESKMHVIDQLMERATGKTLLLITHDYYVAAACDRVVVMYSGQIIEDGPAHIVLTAPRHPYVIGLWQALPENGLRPMPGTMDRDKTANCRFMNRCPFRDEKCHTPQELREIGDAHLVRCCHA
jgi:oligopeptide/dipeptide ABC transporter ATP-binding protein